MKNHRAAEREDASPTLDWPTQKISNRSLAGAAVWLLDVQLPGCSKHHARIIWAWEAPTASMISALQFAELVRTCQQFLWSLMTNPPTGRAGLNQSSLVTRSNWLKMIVRWMAREGIPEFKAMTASSFSLLREWLASRKNRRTGKPIKSTTLSKYFYLISDLYRQRAKLRDAPTVDPLERERVAVAAGRYSTEPIPAVPDALAVHLLSAALRMVEHHSEGVIEAELMTHSLFVSMSRAGWSTRTYRRTAAERLRAAALIDFDGLALLQLSQVHRSAQLLRDACFVVIGGFVGMRISEILSMRVGAIELHYESEGGEPQAYLVGRLFKTASSLQGRVERWLAPAAAVTAVRVLERLNAPLRERSGRTELNLRRNDVQTETGVLPTRQSINERLNAFAQAVNLPLHQNKRWLLSSHQLRKTFARFIAKRDRTQLLGLADHFKHASIAMTSRSYVGTDFELHELISGQARNETAVALERMLTSNRLAGRLGERIHARGAMFRGRAGEQVRRDYIEFILRETDLRVHACDYGWCVFQHETARCEGELAPDEARRSPAVCLSCSNMVVEAKHADYWIDRRNRNARLVPAASLLTRAALVEAIEQCDGVLKQLDAKLGQHVDAKELASTDIGNGTRISRGARKATPRRRSSSSARRSSGANHASRSSSRSSTKSESDLHDTPRHPRRNPRGD